jgi:multimeric flavodoxin WrbA
MKILAINGSPRKGNTEWMLNKLLEFIDGDKELILLREKEIKHCKGCNVCYGTGKPCILDDGMKEIYDKLIEADILIFATPNFFRNVSGTLKVLIDRTNAICDPLRLKGKKAAILSVGAQDFSNTKYCEDTLKRFVEGHEMELIGSLMAKAEGPDDLAKDPEIENRLKELGEKINAI